MRPSPGGRTGAQFLGTRPFELRYRVVYDPALCSPVLRSFSTELARWYIGQVAEPERSSSQRGWVEWGDGNPEVRL